MTKSEGRINDEARMTNDPSWTLPSLGFRPSGFGFDSSFGFRHSSFHSGLPRRITKNPSKPTRPLRPLTGYNPPEPLEEQTRMPGVTWDTFERYQQKGLDARRAGQWDSARV